MSATSGWQELSYTANKDQVDALEDWLFAAGAISITLEDDADQPLLEPGPRETPLWDAVRLTALFPGDMDLQPLLDTIPPQPVLETPRAPVMVIDQEWTRVWEEQFHPLRMGARLWICPSWTPPPDPNAINILLDPGLAFGTGTHPTTAMCLRAIDAGLSEGQRIIDYGCGSGILGISAARLGAATVLAVDNDPQAIAASLYNAAKNQVCEATFSAVLPDDASLRGALASADWVVANILAAPLIDLAPNLMLLMAPGGRLLLAGLLSNQVEAVVAAYAPTVKLEVVDQVEDWVLLAGRRSE